MVLEDRHISYLTLVRQGVVKLWWNPIRSISRYVNVEKTSDIDQIVAAQMKALGATRIIYKAGQQYVALTPRGESLLVDEDEAWA